MLLAHISVNSIKLTKTTTTTKREEEVRRENQLSRKSLRTDVFHIRDGPGEIRQVSSFNEFPNNKN